MARIYVGNLPTDIKERELDDLFYKYGRIKHIDIKTPQRPPSFAFITFDDVRDAEDAVRARDGYRFDGNRLRCEFAKGERGGGRGDDRGRGRGGGDRPRNVPQRTEYRVTVTNLPPSCSWQDLKDFMRKAGEVTYTNVDREGGGVCEFANKDDMNYAIDKMDDTEFTDRRGGTSMYVRIRPENGAEPPRNRSRSRSRSAGGGGGDDDRRDRSRSRSRSRSPSRDKKDYDDEKPANEDAVEDKPDGTED